MTRRRVAMVGLFVLLAALPASAQQAPVTSPAASAAQNLPPGHPVIAPGTQASDSKGFQPPPDIADPDTRVPVGAVSIQILDKRGQPVPDTQVELGILHQSIAEGESHAARSGKTDKSGRLEFSSLEVASGISYRVSVSEGRADYATPPFNLSATMGQRVVLHIYPSTDDIRATMVGMRGFGYIQPRDDAFQFEFMFNVFNIGQVTWIPQKVHLDLPKGWKAFVAKKGMSDTRFVADGDSGIKLVGTFSPGQHQVSFRFQVPNEHDATTKFDMQMPPHVASMQMVVESAPGMTMRINGFNPAEPATNNNGQRVLVAVRQLQGGEPQMKQLAVTLAGVPTPPEGRWYAVVIAIAFGIGGLGIALDRSRDGRKHSLQIASGDIEQSRELLLDELVALERARQLEEIGPRTYESTRRTLLDALARLETIQPETPAKDRKHKTGATRHGKRNVIRR